MQFRFLLIPIIICILTPIARCVTASTTAASQPATTPSVAADSPKAALKAYNLAMHNGDVDAMLALQNANTEDERHVARCASQGDLQIAILEQAARDKFGEDGVKKLAAAIDDEDDAAVDASSENITGDRAGIRFAGSSSSVPMIRAHDRWMVDIAVMLKDSGGSTDDLCDQLIHRGSVAKVIGQEITAGQFASATAAAEALRSRLKE